MVPEPESSADDRRAPVDATTIEPGELYVVVRKAVEDAILGVIGTLLLVGVALVLVWVGIAIAASAYDRNVGTAIGGLFVTVFGFYLAASTLEVVPSVGELVRGR